MRISRAADQDARIDAKGISDQAEHDDGADAEAAASHRKSHATAAYPAAAVIAAVIDVVAAAKIIVTHGLISSLQFAAAHLPPHREDGRIFFVSSINPPGKNCLVEAVSRQPHTCRGRTPNRKSP